MPALLNSTKEPKIGSVETASKTPTYVRSDRMETKTAEKGFQTDPQGCSSGRAVTIP